MPSFVARRMTSDLRTLYVGYEKLVAAGARLPARQPFDRHRMAVGGVLFGSCASDVVYGVLSVTTRGVATYGQVHCRLRDVAVKKRVSFLETNSYVFVGQYHLGPNSSVPPGHRAVWDNRDDLAVAKLQERLAPGHTEADCQAVLVRSDGKDRQNDDFMEAHIYGTFNVDAIEAMTIASEELMDDEDILDAIIACEKHRTHRERREES